MKVDRVNGLLKVLYGEFKALSDEGRDLPILWNMMHMFSSSQLAKILALQRGANAELAAIACVLHDLAVVRTKRHKGHAENAEVHVRDAIHRYNNVVEDRSLLIQGAEEEVLLNAIVRHSEKATYTEDPFVELLKDVDSLDRYLHGVKTEGAHQERCNRVLIELGISAGVARVDS